MISSVRPVSQEIRLDRRRVLRVDIQVFAAIEEIIGASLLTPRGSEAFLAMTTRQLRDVLWAMLSQDDADLTREDVGRMLTRTDLALGSPIAVAMQGLLAQARANPPNSQSM